MEIHFILYRPAVPENVGAAARALKTMGFSKLRLIEPCDHLSREARMLAHASNEVLEQAGVYRNFEEATRDLDLIVCTTAKGRSSKHDYHSSRDLGAFLSGREMVLDSVGILFGTEESGLPNELILRSDLAASIPMAGGYPSLNLAQSVMVMAYELSVLNEIRKPGETLTKSGEGYATMKQQSEAQLQQIGISEGSPLYHRIMERLATTGANDIPLFLSVLARLRKES